MKGLELKRILEVKLRKNIVGFAKYWHYFLFDTTKQASIENTSQKRLCKYTVSAEVKQSETLLGRG